MNKKAHVIFASDDRGARPLAVALYSLLKTHDFSRHSLTVSILNGEGSFSSVSRELIQSVANRFQAALIETIDIDPLLDRYRSFFEYKAAWPITTWARCFIAELFPCEDDNIVYLDIDTLVAHDLSDLYDLNFVLPYHSVLPYKISACAINEEGKQCLKLIF